MVNQATNQCQPRTKLSFGCAEGRTKGSQEDRIAFGHVFLGVNGFGHMVSARLHVLELNHVNQWPTLVAGSAAHHWFSFSYILESTKANIICMDQSHIWCSLCSRNLKNEYATINT